ncbi:MAG: saccharopine dehydrogenase NADP-binding domain-containing protein [Rhodothermaceae bacterium]|nr:saccharopine dehydrogenase NADP-binding domain-containing protein [Rhodothermaceae bacterium]
MKVTVIGAGPIGSAIARDLVERDNVSHVQVCDSHARLLQQLDKRLKSPKLRSFQVDVRDLRVLSSILNSSDVAIGAVVSTLNPRLARLCLDQNIHFCDLGGDDNTVHEILAMNEEAKRKSIWLVPNCGLAPGLVNVLSRTGIAEFDEVDTVRLRVGDVPLSPEPPFKFRLSWSANKILEDYTLPVRLIEDGKVIEADSLTRDEKLYFGEPFGAMEAFCTAGGLSTLVHDLSDQVKTLDHKTIRWPGHADQMRFLIGLGFADQQKIDVRTHLTYRDVLIRRMKRRLGGEHEDAVLMRVLVKGKKEGADKTLVYEMIELYDKKNELTAIQRTTSIPATTVACMIGSGSITGGGAAPAENVVPADAFLKTIADRGLVISKKWYDERIPVISEELGLSPVSS